MQQRPAQLVLGPPRVAGGEHLADRAGSRPQPRADRGEQQRRRRRAVGQPGYPGHRVRQAAGQEHESGGLPERGHRRPGQGGGQPGDARERPQRPPPPSGRNGHFCPSCGEPLAEHPDVHAW